ncbi:5'-nucleotidase domain-containing protein 3-like [Tubulanus polymorphus]|uniref:5'-nucleotidase domain-containing protein 3-like n=1 Tax=Tubulanus polymorphus TaxID=672921 RepID=UPI003DA2863A
MASHVLLKFAGVLRPVFSKLRLNWSAVGLRDVWIGKNRQYCTIRNKRKVDLWEEYHKTRASLQGVELPADVDATAIFANNETSLSEVEVYGFDYDYTLASYKPSLHNLIYNLGRYELVTNHKYPKDILNINYNPEFAVRGLHYDVQKGLLLKIDAFHNIQLGTVYRGLEPVPADEVIKLYDGTHVPVENMNSFHGTVGKKVPPLLEVTPGQLNTPAQLGKHMYQLMDLFALPEMTLLSNVINYFHLNNIPYDPEYVFYDVKSAVQGLHSTGALHSCVVKDLDEYMTDGRGIQSMLNRLKDNNKKLFLITNSPFSFVDRGMHHIVGPDWTDLFDVIIASARKPKFFNESARPFRRLDKSQRVRTFGRVTELKKGEIYLEGNLAHFREMTKWFGSKVLYFGDHVYSDLADANLKHGWRTGAVIPELENEIKALNSPTFKHSVRWSSALQDLIHKMQVYEDAESQAILNEWMKERDELRVVTKQVFNPQFGSLFRTHHNPTYFSRRLARFADLYMSSIENLLNYSVNYTFYPRRSALPHEVLL